MFSSRAVLEFGFRCADTSIDRTETSWIIEESACASAPTR